MFQHHAMLLSPVRYFGRIFSLSHRNYLAFRCQGADRNVQGAAQHATPDQSSRDGIASAAEVPAVPPSAVPIVTPQPSRVNSSDALGTQPSAGHESRPEAKRKRRRSGKLDEGSGLTGLGAVLAELSRRRDAAEEEGDQER